MLFFAGSMALIPLLRVNLLVLLVYGFQGLIGQTLLNDATDKAQVITLLPILIGLAPVQAFDQLPKLAPVPGVAVRVTVVPWATSCAQLAPPADVQLIPTELVTMPFPVTVTLVPVPAVRSTHSSTLSYALRPVHEMLPLPLTLMSAGREPLHGLGRQVS